MPSNVLALIFAFVMVVLVWTNHIREAVNALPSPAYGLFNASTIAPAPLPPPMQEPVLEVLPFALDATAYLLVRDDGLVFVEQNAGKFLPIASLTKLMTAVVFEELFPEEKALIISPDAMTLDNNVFGLVAGGAIPKDKALEFMLIVSSNIVAQSAADAIGAQDFVRRMNDRAIEIGMVNTVFIDPSGLGDDNRSSARDIVRFIQFIAAEHPEILAISRMPSSLWGTSVLLNTNELLGMVPGIVGGKTGHTVAAKECLALMFERNGRAFYAVLLGSQNRFADMRELIEYARSLP